MNGLGQRESTYISNFTHNYELDYFSSQKANIVISIICISFLLFGGIVVPNDLYGDDKYWNVRKKSFLGRDHHSGTAITPWIS